jgi:predicted nucleic acid-binding protein
MKPTYLVDTDWVIHYLNGHAGIVRRLDELKERGLALSVASLAEIYEGIYYSTDPSGNETDLNDFLRGVVVIGIDEETCKVFGAERGVAQRLPFMAAAPSQVMETALMPPLRHFYGLNHSTT